MFDPASRYRDVPVAVHVDDRGRPRPWVTLRVPPATGPTVTSATRPHDRLDLLAYRTYGDPGAWWRIVDANPAAAAAGPAAVLEPPGTPIELPQPVSPEALS
ncbi:tail protein X [Kitasatospora sp. NPDC101447]|uniref:tail protein X n=1 Tax=Kitasatospora sp. NPDC101447 TaxID=3364102 RepID=UPI003815F39F